MAGPPYQVDYEPGYTGQITSLAGVKGRPGLGLRLDAYGGALAAGDTLVLLPPNTLRKWAAVHNRGAGPVDVHFTANPGTMGYSMILPGVSSLLINEEWPWTGGVTVTALAGSAGATVFGWEACISL